jgi:hypothetical protein
MRVIAWHRWPCRLPVGEPKLGLPSADCQPPVAEVSKSVGHQNTPLTAWALQSYASIKWIFCLWLLLIIWIFVAFAVRLYGLIIVGALLLTISGLVGIRFVGRR